MIPIVQGRNALLKLKYDGVYRLIACIEKVRLFIDTKLSPTSTPTSGLYLTQHPSGMSEWYVAAEGVVAIDDPDSEKFTARHLLMEQVRQNGLDMELVLTDSDGTSLFIYGKVFPSPTELIFDVSDIGSFNTTFSGSGTLTLNDVEFNINSTEVNLFQYTASGIENGVITHPTLANINIIWIDRADAAWTAEADSGIQPDPDHRGAVHNRGAGTLDFGLDFGAGEQVRILYKPL